MQNKLIEIMVGAIVLAVGAGFLLYAYKIGGRGNHSGYQISAKFDRIDGLRKGSEVRMSGIKIGSVVSQTLDPHSYLAIVKFSINSQLKIPTDSSAQIASDGLLGNKYLSLQPGAEEQMISPGGEITHTQGAVDIVSLVGRMIFSQSKSSEKKKTIPSLR